MHLHLIAAGQRLPHWINQGFNEFNKRLPKEYKLQLREIAINKRQKNHDIARCIENEGASLLKAIPKNAKIIALSIAGESWSTGQLAQRLADWSLAGQDIAFIIGGPDGLSAQILSQCHQRWSLSPLTFPHGLARVLLAEQIYRAWSMMNSHPYHR